MPACLCPGGTEAAGEAIYVRGVGLFVVDSRLLCSVRNMRRRGIEWGRAGVTDSHTVKGQRARSELGTAAVGGGRAIAAVAPMAIAPCCLYLIKRCPVGAKTLCGTINF